MSRTVLVAGAGMVPFTKPGTGARYDVMGGEAGRLALADAGIAYEDVEQAFAGYVFGDSTSGQKVLYGLGMTGIPIDRLVLCRAQHCWPFDSVEQRHAPDRRR